MSATKKVNSNLSYSGRAIVVDNLKSHENDPFFVKKVEDAKIAVSKLKLPGTEKK
ncbi:hypothetical protein [Mucilaginibacter sp.]|uniref:hypothetical protein n=1 Tax=Mucilaginibacter sp. TaxID=1882438 RepID=UPI0025F1A98A|nr:hypothetical protein [Mucilaginibacter sp.]